MSGSPVALVADDRDLGRSLEECLNAQLGRPVFRLSFADIASHLDRDTNGLVLFAVAQARDAEAGVRLLQDLSRQKYPCAAAVIEGNPAVAAQLECLDRYITRRLRWPTDGALLISLVKELGRGRPFPASRAEALE